MKSTTNQLKTIIVSVAFVCLSGILWIFLGNFLSSCAPAYPTANWSRTAHVSIQCNTTNIPGGMCSGSLGGVANLFAFLNGYPSNIDKYAIRIIVRREDGTNLRMYDFKHTTFPNSTTTYGGAAGGVISGDEFQFQVPNNVNYSLVCYIKLGQCLLTGGCGRQSIYITRVANLTTAFSNDYYYTIPTEVADGNYICGCINGTYEDPTIFGL